MPKPKSATKFTPCVRTYFRNSAVTMGTQLDKKFLDMSEKITAYEGDQDQEVMDALWNLKNALGPAQDALLALAKVLNTKCSQPQDI